MKGFFYAAGDWMQVSTSATQIIMDTITIEIPKSQVVMLAKRGILLFTKEVTPTP